MGQEEHSGREEAGQPYCSADTFFSQQDYSFAAPPDDGETAEGAV
jgi:hypothetical protein